MVSLKSLKYSNTFIEMLRRGRFLICIALFAAGLSGCLGSLWTGASLVYDRHNVYKKLNDYHLTLEVNNALYSDKKFKDPVCVIDIAVFNGDVLVVGHLPSADFLEEARRRLGFVHGYRRFFNELNLSDAPANAMQDSWITGKIRAQIFADSSIDPNTVKIITADRVVYLMGDMRADEAKKVISIARHASGVEHVVKVLKYLTYDQISSAKGY